MDATWAACNGLIWVGVSGGFLYLRKRMKWAVPRVRSRSRLWLGESASKVRRSCKLVFLLPIFYVLVFGTRLCCPVDSNPQCSLLKVRPKTADARKNICAFWFLIDESRWTCPCFCHFLSFALSKTTQMVPWTQLLTQGWNDFFMTGKEQCWWGDCDVTKAGRLSRCGGITWPMYHCARFVLADFLECYHPPNVAKTGRHEEIRGF